VALVRLPINTTLATICICAFSASVSVRAQDRAAGEALPGADAALAQSLVAEGMPELVEEVVRRGTPAHQVLVARAYARAAELDDDVGRREADLSKSVAAYRQSLTVQDDPAWSAGARRRFAIASWRVELADVILRKQCAADLDEFERLSGLRRPLPRLGQRLSLAIREYRQADASLKEFTTLLARDEDPLLLEGIADAVGPVARRCSLNLAWALVYRATITSPKESWRAEDLNEALRRFDGVGRESTDQNDRLSSAVGAGIAFRESDRLDDALAVFDGITRSASNGELRTRAKYELGRTATKRGDFAAAARTFDELAAETADPKLPAAGSFYLQLAPVLAAYSRLLQSQGSDEPQAAALRQQAFDSLMAQRARGGTWSAVIDVYLNQVVPADANPAMLSPTERLALGRRLAATGDYARAATMLQAFIDRPDAASPSDRDAARYELAQCLRRTGQLRPAALALAELADKASDAGLARRAIEDAVEAWRAIVAASALREDELELATISLKAAAQTKDTNASEELVLRAGAAFERAGRPDEAQATYARIPKTSARYWAARFGAARCRQAAWHQRDATLSTADAARTVGALVREWDDLAEQLRPTASSPEQRELLAQATINSAELMAGPRLRQYADALKRLATLDLTGLPPGVVVRVISIRLRCHRELKQDDASDATSRALLDHAKSMEPGAGLVAAAAELEAEVDQRSQAGRADEAQRLAVESLPIVQRLLDAITADPSRAADLSIVRFSMARMLVNAGRGSKALPLLTDLSDSHPGNNAYLRYRATALEQIARSNTATPAQRTDAEKAWARLLEDRTLRDTSPDCYWEARYYWLRWQLDAGRGDEVVRGIDSERAWHPDLGGSPWKERLLELAAKCRK